MILQVVMDLQEQTVRFLLIERYETNTSFFLRISALGYLRSAVKSLSSGSLKLLFLFEDFKLDWLLGY